jgi:hypothetical protein
VIIILRAVPPIVMIRLTRRPEKKVLVEKIYLYASRENLVGMSINLLCNNSSIVAKELPTTCRMGIMVITAITKRIVQRTACPILTERVFS